MGNLDVLGSVTQSVPRDVDGEVSKETLLRSTKQ